MRTDKLNKNRMIFFIVIFAGIISIPAFLTCVFRFTGISIDRELKGNFDKVDRPEITFESAVDGDLMPLIENYFHNSFQGRGIIITTYNQIRHSIFNENSSDYKGKALISDGYIKAKLGIEDFDCENQLNKENIEAFVSRLTDINRLLAKRDKTLIVIRALNKADYFPEYIPYYYKFMKTNNAPSTPEYYHSLMKDSEIVYFNTKEYVDSLDCDYPVYYKSSHHWSRPVEQMVENKLFEIIEESSGHEMERYEFEELQSVDFPVDRDGDILDLINIWKDTGEIYSRYKVNPVISEEPVNICIQGDSYTTLISQDMVNNGHNGHVTNIFYDEVMYKDNEEIMRLNHDFSYVDFDALVAENDVFVICYTDNNLYFGGYGFTEAMLDYLQE